MKMEYYYLSLNVAIKDYLYYILTFRG